MFDHEIDQNIFPRCWEQLGKKHPGLLTSQTLYIYVYKVIVYQDISFIQQGDTEHTLAVY